MTSKFKIFCDEPQTIERPEKELPSKREPLAMKQHFVHKAQLKLQENHHLLQPQQPHLQQQQHQPLSQVSSQVSSQATSQESTHQPASNRSPLSSAYSEQEQDQENDISIASLGSDFVPSIIHDSFECEDEEANMTATSVDTEGEHQYDEFAIDGYYDEDQKISLDDGLDDDIDLDEETRLELSQALKKHDESALFNCVAFNHDIIEYLHKLESDPSSRPAPNYMVFHDDIDSNKRSILINWLVEVADEYDLQTETLFICVNIIDRFLSKMSVTTSHFQLLGVAAMFIATKYEEIYPPYLSQFVEVTDETFSGKQIIQMEQEILKNLDFRISMPTVTFFLRQIFAHNKFTKKVYHLAEYLCYLSLLADRPFLDYYPSEIALAAVILAAHQLNAAANISPELKSSYDKSNQSQVKRRDASQATKYHNHRTSRNVFGSHEHVMDKDLPFCIESLRAMQERVPCNSAVYIKYSATAHDCVAQLPPLKVEDLHHCA